MANEPNRSPVDSSRDKSRILLAGSNGPDRKSLLAIRNLRATSSSVVLRAASRNRAISPHSVGRHVKGKKTKVRAKESVRDYYEPPLL